MTNRVMSGDDSEKRPGNIRIALLLAAIAVAVYLTFIASGVVGALGGE